MSKCFYFVRVLLITILVIESECGELEESAKNGTRTRWRPAQNGSTTTSLGHRADASIFPGPNGSEYEEILLESICQIPAGVAHQLCKAFYRSDHGVPKNLEHCPPTSALANMDPRFINSGIIGLDYFHAGAKENFRQKVLTRGGAGQQCVYDESGNLIVGPPNGGSADLHSPRNPTGEAEHILYDILPWCACCKSSNMKDCNKYYKKRPSDDGKLYRPDMALKP